MNTTFKNSEVKKDVEYTPADFLFRLKAVRNLAVHKECDGVLIINGPHGGDNEESAKQTNWLFQGYVGHKQFYNTVEDDMWDETMFLITKNKFYGYLYPKQYQQNINKLIQIPNAYFYVPTQEEIDETPDALENTKVREFLRFVKEYAIFGMPARGKGDKRMKIVERFPMIQAYGVDGVGGGFFTMRNRVIDICSELNGQYMKNDLNSKQMMINNLAVRLLNNCEAAIVRISHTMQKNKATDLTESMLSSVMHETFDFGKMNRSEEINTKLPLPRILFGDNTNNAILKGASDSNMRDCYWKPEYSALHFTIENVESMSMIRCARTYFLTSNAPRMYLIEPLFNDEGHEFSYDIKSIKDSEFTDEFKLTNIYCKVLQTYMKFTSTLAKNITSGGRERLKQVIEKKIIDLNNKLTKLNNTTMKEKVVVDIKFYTTLGKEFDITEMDFTSSKENQLKARLDNYIVVVRVAVHDIMSVTTENNLGAIVLADTFMFERKNHYNLTKSFPYFDFYDIRLEYSNSLSKMRELFSQDIFGERIQRVCEKVDVYIPLTQKLDKSKIDFPVFEASIAFFEKCFKFTSEKLGHWLLTFDEIKKVELMRKLDKPIAILHLQENKFFPKLTEPTIVFRFTGESIQKIFIKLKDHFAQIDVPVVDIDQYPELLQISVSLVDANIIPWSVHEKALSKGKNEEEDEDEPKQKENLELVQQNIFEQFCKGNQIAYTYNTANTKAKSLKLHECNDLLNIPKLVITNKGNIPLKKEVEAIIVTGPLCSDKRQFGEMLLSLHQKFPIDKDQTVGLVSYDETELPLMTDDFFYDKVIKYVKAELFDGDWVIIVVPHTVDHCRFIDKISDQVLIKNIVTKLILAYMFDSHKNTVTNLQHYLIPGYCQHVFLDSLDISEMRAANLTILLQEIFPQSKFVKIQQNRPIYATISDMIRDESYGSDRNIFLRKIYTRELPTLDKVYHIPYRQPVDSSKWQELKARVLEKDGVMSKNTTDEEWKAIERKEKAHKKKYKTYESEYRLQDELAKELEDLKEYIKPMLEAFTRDYPLVKYMRGYVRFTDKLEDGVYLFQFSRWNCFEKKLDIGTSVSDVELAPSFMVKQASYTDWNVGKLGFYIMGSYIDSKEIVKWLNMNLLPRLEKKLPMVIDDLEDEFLKDMEYNNRKNDLGDAGVFFDGHFFRNLYGDILEGHPNREKMFQDYLDEENKKINEENTLNRENEKLKRKFYQNN